MEKNRINVLINNPSEATDRDIVLLEEQIKKYPYAQVLHILLAKIQFLRNNYDKNEKLTSAAIYSVDRAVLKKLILDKDFRVNNEKVTPFQDIPNFKREIIPDLPEKSESFEHVNHVEPDSSSIFADVLKNLEQLKSLRKQFQFLELNESEEPETEEHVRENKSETIRPDEGAIEEPKKIRKVPKTPDNSKATKKEITKSESKKTEIKKKKQAEILEKDEELDSRVNVFFLNEIEKNEKPNESISQNDKHLVQNQIIERFIEEQPSIGTIKKEVGGNKEEANKDLAENSTKFTDDLVSENLAVIMLKQGKKDRAVDIYKKLIWKLPQKKAYFAARIEEINK